MINYEASKLTIFNVLMEACKFLCLTNINQIREINARLKYRDN